MRLLRVLTAALLVAPILAVAADPALTRREGFLEIWRTLKRPVGEMRLRPTRYEDVPVGAPGEEVITYARHRSLLGEVPHFRPDEALLFQDAVIWLLRTRNAAADPAEVNAITLPDWMKRYPVTVPATGLQTAVTRESLASLITEFDRLMKEEVHLISNYGAELHGAGTAFGETFDMHAMTAAHKYLPYNTLIRVTNVANGKSVVVRINDRGPFVHGRDLDMSAASFALIADGKTGTLEATIERLGDVAFAGPCYQAPRYQSRIGHLILEPGVPFTLPLGQTVTLRSDRIFTVRDVRGPDGTQISGEQWVAAGESFVFTPETEGRHLIRIRNGDGIQRLLRTNVVPCG